ncbi:MAG: cytochrome b562 [Nibricoccus sp.]
MTLRTACFALLISSSVVSPVVLNAQPPAHEETELGGKMDSLNSAFRKLRKQVTDATKNAESLKLVAQMRSAVAESEKLVPTKAAEIAEADREKFVAAYQAKLKEFDGKIIELEAALKADKNEEAAKILSALGAMQKDGHKEFKKQEKH